MSETVERVAEAIWKRRHPNSADMWSAALRLYRGGFRSDAEDVFEAFDDARAAIAAMREPTETMLGSAMDYWPEHDDPPTPPEDYWQAMIDAALAEGEK